MSKLRVGVCCTFGAGSSMMLKMNLDGVFNKMGVFADVIVFDISSIKGEKLDAIYTSAALLSQVEQTVAGSGVMVIPVVNYFDLKGLEELTNKHFLKK